MFGNEPLQGAEADIQTDFWRSGHVMDLAHAVAFLELALDLPPPWFQRIFGFLFDVCWRDAVRGLIEELIALLSREVGVDRGLDGAGGRVGWRGEGGFGWSFHGEES